MRKIGLVGGVGWPGTAAYYTAICEAGRPYCSGGSPRMMIDSLDMRETLASRGEIGLESSWEQFDGHFIDAIDRLEKGGCQLAAIASVTPHLRFETISNRSRLPLVSILDATARAVALSGTDRALALGTTVTMNARLFDHALKAEGIDPGGSLGADRIAALGKLLEDYFYVGKGIEGREQLLKFCRDSIDGEKQTTIILGCTDFILAFPEHAGEVSFEVDGLHFVDSMAAHVDAILKMAMG